MALKNQTELGLTFGQIIAVIGLLSVMFTSWVSLSERMAKNEARVIFLEDGRIQNARNIETGRIENKADFKEISDKLDKLILMKEGKR